MRAVACGVLLPFALLALPTLRRHASGVDHLAIDEWLVLALPLLLGALLGRLGRRSRQRLFVVVIATVVVAATNAISIALELLRSGDLALLGATAAAYGVVLGVLAPRPLGPGPMRWAGPTFGASVAAITVAAWTFGEAADHPDAMARVLTLLPVLALLLASGAVAPTSSFVPSPFCRPLGLVVLLTGAIALAATLPTTLQRIVPPLVSALLLAAVAGWWLSVFAAWRRGVLGFAAIGCAATLLLIPPGGPDPARCTILQRNGVSLAAYDRGRQEMQLWHGEVLVDAEGPDRPQAPFVATALRILLHRADRILVLGDGLGRLPAALHRAGLPQVEVASWRTEASSLLRCLQNDGPVVDPRQAPPPSPTAPRGPLAALAGLTAGSRQAIVMGEPLHDGAPNLDPTALQQELRRVAGAGLVLQPFAMDRVPPARLRAWLAAAAVSHQHNAVFAVGACGLLISSGRPLRLPTGSMPLPWSDAARWQAHRAHLGSPADLARALLGYVRADADAVVMTLPPTPGRASTLDILHAMLTPGPELAPCPRSQLLWWRGQQVRLQQAERALRRAPATAAGRAGARELALSLLPFGAPSAVLQAALALPDAAGARLCSPDTAVLNAHAIDPLFLDSVPAVLAELPRARRPQGDLEDIARLWSAPRLAELCSANTSQAIALRVRFGSRCAQALVQGLADGPLPRPQHEALRQLADPFVLEEAGRCLGARGALPELLGLWRGDLPLPAAVRPLLRGSAADRQLLAAALSGRRDAGSFAALADLMVDEAADVRRAAAASLTTTTGDAVAYDAEWPRSRRFLAAERVRAMHNRGP